MRALYPLIRKLCRISQAIHPHLFLSEIQRFGMENFFCGKLMFIHANFKIVIEFK